MEKDKTELQRAPVQAAPLASQRPPQPPQEGFEQMDSGDYTLPRLALCQSGSPQKKKSDPKYIQGLDEGQLFNSITGTVYDKVRIVPLMFWKGRILFKDMNEGGGILCQALDNLHGVGEPGGDCLVCPLSQFGSSKKEGSNAPACMQFYNYAVLVMPEGKGKVVFGPEMLAVLSIKSTGLKTAKDWNALMRLRNKPMFAFAYDVTSAEQKKPGMAWFTHVIKPAGEELAGEHLSAARSCYQAVLALQVQGKLKIDAEDLAGDDEDPASAARTVGSREPGDDAPTEV